MSPGCPEPHDIAVVPNSSVALVMSGDYVRSINLLSPSSSMAKFVDSTANGTSSDGWCGDPKLIVTERDCQSIASSLGLPFSGVDFYKAPPRNYWSDVGPRGCFLESLFLGPAAQLSQRLIFNRGGPSWHPCSGLQACVCYAGGHKFHSPRGITLNTDDSKIKAFIADGDHTVKVLDLDLLLAA
jgi:hypothetical protein